MKKETSAGAIVFKENDKRDITYLLLQSKKWKTWGFPKGHIEKCETEKETALREIIEETSLTREFLPKFLETYSYTFEENGKQIEKKVTFFLVKLTNNKNVILSNEHQQYKWVSYKEAMSLLTYENTKTLLNKANNFLLEKAKCL